MTIAISALTEKLAIHGGRPAITDVDPELFHWPIVTDEDEQAVVAVLRAGSMSGLDITRKFETEFATWLGTTYALASCNGTTSLLEAMFAVGIGRGDEMIAPSLTYWATVLQCFSLGATPVFADVDPHTLNIDPGDIEHRISKNTKAIIVVHHSGYPCEMDAIMSIARKHGLKVIEDVSHAHGGLYRGKKVGTLGDVAAMSMMSAKGFAVGEGGMLCTNDREIYERAIAFAHYERTKDELTLPSLEPLKGLPLGGIKGRLNQTCAAMGRVQLKYYDQRMSEIQDAMNRFWDLLDGVPGIRAHRPPRNSGCTMGGWYNPLGHYVSEELSGLPLEKFLSALAAEGVPYNRGLHPALHTHPLLNTADVYRDGKPTRLAFASRDVRQPHGSLPVTESLDERVFGVPGFKRDRAEDIERFAGAYRKVAMQSDSLL